MKAKKLPSFDDIKDKTKPGHVTIVSFDKYKKKEGGLKDFLTCNPCKAGNHKDCRADSWYPVCQCSCWLER